MISLGLSSLPKAGRIDYQWDLRWQRGPSSFFYDLLPQRAPGLGDSTHVRVLNRREQTSPFATTHFIQCADDEVHPIGHMNLLRSMHLRKEFFAKPHTYRDRTQIVARLFHKHRFEFNFLHVW